MPLPPAAFDRKEVIRPRWLNLHTPTCGQWGTKVPKKLNIDTDQFNDICVQEPISSGGSQGILQLPSDEGCADPEQGRARETLQGGPRSFGSRTVEDPWVSTEDAWRFEPRQEQGLDELTCNELAVWIYLSSPIRCKLWWWNMLGYSSTVMGYFCNRFRSGSGPYKRGLWMLFEGLVETNLLMHCSF